MPQLSWINSKGYSQGIFWMLVVCFISNCNDILTKHVGGRLSGFEVAFFRFFFSTIVLLPFMTIGGKAAFMTRHPSAQYIRALLLMLAVSPWCYGVATLPLTLATTLSFSSPVFLLPLARIFLKEPVGWQRWFATLFGFAGILVALHPTGTSFNPMALALVASTIMFATLDINQQLCLQPLILLTKSF